MNKLFSLLFLLSIIISSNLFSQEIPNGNLEMWELIDSHEDPVNWVTNNNDTFLFAEKEEDSCEADFGMKVFPGVFIEALPGIAYTEFLINTIPDQLHFCAMSNIYSDDFQIDTCTVEIIFFNGLEEVHQAIWTNTVSIENWETFTLDLEGSSAEVTSARINIQASYPIPESPFQANPQTWINVDDFYFETIDNLSDDFSQNEINVYPNPAINQIHIRNILFQKAIILDISGKEVLTSFSNPINISTLESGTYFISLEVNDQFIALQRFIKN